jgi:hypothetical protein
VKLGSVSALATGLAVAALVSAGPALAQRGGSPGKGSGTTTVGQPVAGTQSVQGVVQSVAPSTVVVRELDGTIVGVPIGARTKVTVDGKSARIGDVKPGYVLVATWKAGQPAPTLRFLRTG